MGYIGNLSANGSGVTVVNNGLINNYSGTNSLLINNGQTNNASVYGSATTLNNGLIKNLYATDDTMTLNNGRVDNARLFAGNGDNLYFQNTGLVKNLDADVNSTNNTGFITIDNFGKVNNADLFDNVPAPPAPNNDLITYNNMGYTGNLTTGTSGVGRVDVNNWGSIDSAYLTGNTNLWNYA